VPSHRSEVGVLEVNDFSQETGRKEGKIYLVFQGANLEAFKNLQCLSAVLYFVEGFSCITATLATKELSPSAITDKSSFSILLYFRM
jgi:hypothetical protein